MARICYLARDFAPKTLEVIRQAETICAEYDAQGFTLTLRQLYYQFVARDLIPNRQSEYKRLGSIINDARLAGELDWRYLEDRTRNLESRAHWDDPADVIDAAARAYNRDLWGAQPQRVEVWIEKDALVGVIDPICRELDVAYFSCRGYTSQSEMHAAAMRLRRYIAAGQTVTILHLGDHDPSGIDMSRDIADRLALFLDYSGDAGAFDLRRIALTMGQVEDYAPPPNPAKVTDSRFEGYQRLYGNESWELDALDPNTLAELIRTNVADLTDEDLLEDALDRETEERQTVARISDRYAQIAAWLDEEDSDDDR